MSKKNTPLKGSYPTEDCLFLLKPIEPRYHSIENKEMLIQTGQLHYSEMIHREKPPTEAYTALFLELTARYKQRLAAEVVILAKKIAQLRAENITIVSLARAGTPVGVLLQRALRNLLHRQSTHFSISIIRDRGIDEVALDYILQEHTPESIVFVDGWTAKGTITHELKTSIQAYNHAKGVGISSDLFVISDIGGYADIQATRDDYAIPSALMNSTVSGLISRSILNQQIQAGDFHGCVEYSHLSSYDRSNWFVDEITEEMKKISLEVAVAGIQESKDMRRNIVREFLLYIQETYHISDMNRIKPGIAEATRTLLRRVPDVLIVRDRKDCNVRHLIHLATEKNICVKEYGKMPFGACSLIKDVV